MKIRKNSDTDKCIQDFKRSISCTRTRRELKNKKSGVVQRTPPEHAEETVQCHSTIQMYLVNYT